MQNTVETTATQNTAAGTSAKNTEQDVDGKAFLDELETYMTKPAPAAENNSSVIYTTAQRLAQALPGLTVSRGTAPSVGESPSYHLKNGDNGLVTISEEMLGQMAEDDEMFNKVKDMLSGLFTAGNNQQLSPSTSKTTARWQSVVIDSEGTRYVEVLRDRKTGASTISSLNMRTQEIMSESMDLIFDNKKATRSGGNLFQSSSNLDFGSILGNSTSWNMEIAFSSASQAMETLRASQSFVSRLDILIEQWEVSASTSGDSLLAYMQIMGLSDPLVFDLGGEGINLTSVEDGVYFDIKGDGSPVQTAWISGNNAFLYLDQNGNGIVDDANELFGDHGGFANGFDKLAQYDSNGDGVIDSNDDIFSELRLWRDLNGDGICDDGETMSLEEAGITSINLNYGNDKKLDAHGNVIAEESTFTRSDGTQGTVADAWFQTKKRNPGK